LCSDLARQVLQLFKAATLFFQHFLLTLTGQFTVAGRHGGRGIKRT